VSVELKLLLWWIAFGGTHMVGSSLAVRTPLIRALGLRGFKAVYSVVAFATFIPLVFIAWNHRHAGAVLFDPPSWLARVTEALMFVALLLLPLGEASPNPATTAAELTGRSTSRARGIHRITRHPVNTAFGLFGLAHLLVSPTVGDWIFWGGWVVYAVASAVHQDARIRTAGTDDARAFLADTSAIPFAAIAGGRQHLAWRELNPVAIAIGIVLFAVLRWFHPVWIGGFGG
jgi:uncharacterized membrane protein